MAKISVQTEDFDVAALEQAAMSTMGVSTAAMYPLTRRFFGMRPGSVSTLISPILLLSRCRVPCRDAVAAVGRNLGHLFMVADVSGGVPGVDWR